MRAFISKHKILLSLTAFYLLLRLINLTLLPIFNDEAIYLDWGWRETHSAGHLFYSLYDAKQPLLMWIFGIFQQIIPDQLLAGRLVSVLTGLATMLGIYSIAKKYINKKTAIFSALLYIVIPLFSFYDRQALMESAIASIGIWTVYFLLSYIENPNGNIAILIGVFLGLGFFIKSSALLFVAASICIVFLYRKSSSIKIFLIGSSVGFLVITAFLLFQGQFWQTFSSNSRYTLTLQELVHFPFSVWANNLWTNIQIIFFYITPLVTLLGICGMIFLWNKNIVAHRILIFWLLFSLFLQTFEVRNTSQRYLVFALPLYVVFAGYTLSLLWKKSYLGYLFIVASYVIPFLLTIVQIINPPMYFLEISKYISVSENGYVKGYTSGYGITDVVKYITQESQQNPAIIGIGLHSGNPESAVQVYFQNSSTIHPIYFDGNIVGSLTQQYDCVSFPEPMYFISRGDDTVGVGKFLVKKRTFSDPYDATTTIGVYEAKKNCSGKTAYLTPQKTN